MLKSTASCRLIPTPLQQPPIHCISEGLIGSDERWKAVGQLQLPVRRVDVEQRDDEDGREILSPTFLREQQRSSYTLCAEAAVHTSHWLGKTAFGCPVAGNHPRTARRAAQDRWRRWRRRKLVPTPRQTPLPPHPYYATAVAQPSDTTAGPDRAQRDHLCLSTRAARAALRGRTIIWHHHAGTQGDA
eukprot:COSAG02_NODE_7097_length_3187_cov_5.232513_1_plen_187_part_00